MGNHTDINRFIGSQVRLARAAGRITRKQLAARADVSERYLNELENGEANVSVRILGQVADALDVELTALLPPADRSPSPTPPLAVPHLHPDLAAIIGGMSEREQEGAAPVLSRYLDDRRKSLKGLALMGLRGAGKSTIGGLFACRHGLPFISITREIETRAGMPLNDLFNLGGPDAYRTLEIDVATELAGRSDRIVLETAGGIVSNAEALEVILASFTTVWLKASPEEHLQRVIRQGDMRPMHGTPKALEHLKTLLANREPEYARADVALDTTGLTTEACVSQLERIAGLATAAAL